MPRMFYPGKARDKSTGLTGTPVRIRWDDQMVAIYTIQLDNPMATPDGLLYAREYEVEWLP